MLKMIITVCIYHILGTMMSEYFTWLNLFSSHNNPIISILQMMKWGSEVLINLPRVTVLNLLLEDNNIVVQSRAEEMADLPWNLSYVLLHELFLVEWHLVRAQ